VHRFQFARDDNEEGYFAIPRLDEHISSPRRSSVSARHKTLQLSRAQDWKYLVGARSSQRKRILFSHKNHHEYVNELNTD